MSTESIQFNLRERFAAPLPEFYRRRIVFWKDEDREFEKDVDELNLEGVKIIKLTGTNNFAVKKLLLHDDLESDYLVYEVASELSERIVRNTKGTAELESMQAVFPSITKFGMAALLPGKSISVNDSMDVLVDGNPTRSTVERNAILNSTPKASVAIQYNDLLNMKKDERRELVAGKDIIYIYHNSTTVMHQITGKSTIRIFE